MTWEHLTAMKGGECPILTNDGSVVRACFELAEVSTGRTRAFHGYRLTVEVDGHVYRGDDRHNAIEAVVACARELRSAGVELLVAGMAPGFSESGLSHNSGFGYLEGHGVHMMDPAMVPRADEASSGDSLARIGHAATAPTHDGEG